MLTLLLQTGKAALQEGNKSSEIRILYKTPALCVFGLPLQDDTTNYQNQVSMKQDYINFQDQKLPICYDCRELGPKKRF